MLRQLQERNSRALAFMAEVTHVLVGPEAPGAALTLIVDRVSTLLEAGAVALLGLAPTGRDFTLLAATSTGRGAKLGAGHIFPRAGTILEKALVSRSAVLLPSARTGAFDPILRVLLGELPLKGGYAVPLRVAGVELGGLLVLNPQDGLDEMGVLRDLISFSNLAAIAIERDQRNRADIDETRLLHAVNTVLLAISAGLDEASLISHTMEALLTAFPADHIELMLRDGDDLLPHHLNAPPPDSGDAEKVAYRKTLHHRAIAETQAFGDSSPRFGQPPAIHYWAVVPLRSDVEGGSALGTLLFERRETGFGDKELELFTIVGQRLGAALALARLLRKQSSDLHSLEIALSESAAVLAAARERLAGLEEERASLQSLASLGELAAGVAHDLNNALNPVVAFAELIQEHGDQPERVQMYADRILLAARGGAETVRRIQRFTRRRLGALPFEPISIAGLVSEVVDLTQPSLAKRPAGLMVEVIQSVESNLVIQGNPGELRQALLNLVGNAVDAMPGGGTLRFVARGEADEVVLAVQDTGKGMSKEAMDRALEPFYTTKGAHGTGLGLAEVFGITRRHGGSLELVSHERIGTSVILRLPRTRLKPAPIKVRRRLAGAAANLHQILLVDDNLLSLEATAASLRAAGHAVVTATNAQLAIHLFKAGDYDLALIDLRLPDMHGLELIDKLRELNPRTRLGVITGWSSAEGESVLEEHGVDLFFTKPVDTDQLLAAL